MEKNNWKLLEPIKVGMMSLRNRIVMPPMEARLNNADGSVSRPMIDYYAERARGGCGAIVVQNTHVDNKLSKSALCASAIYSDHFISGYGELAEAIKAEGAAALLQIGHGGRQCAPGATGRQPVAPSAIPCGVIGTMPREMTIDEIGEVQAAFAEAARRAEQAGFDGVEIHGAHGYLIDSFLSPYTNRRNDKYGGALKNRALFSLEVISRVKEKVSRNFTVGYRMSADEYVPGGLTLEETSVFARMLEDAGVAYVHVSAGIYESGHHIIMPMYLEKAHLVHLAAGIKQAVTIPVITVGAHDATTAEAALTAGKADLVALGRSLIADPYLPRKLATGKTEDIRPCIRGHEGCISRFDTGQTMRCEVNPRCGREADYNISPAPVSKKVIVVGGGIAGLEAARVASLREHEVTILEKSDTLGGHLIEATRPGFKGSTAELLRWAIRQVEKGGVKVRLNTEATPTAIKELAPEAVIIAVGSDFIVPPVPGCDKSCAISADEVLLGTRELGERVVVVGGGLIGCETALYIADELGKQVTIVEMLDEMLAGVQGMCRVAIAEKLGALGVAVHLGWRLEAIKDQGLTCRDRDWQAHDIVADSVVLATGLQARSDLVEQFKDVAPDVHVIGDCLEARKISHAFEEAWWAALRI